MRQRSRRGRMLSLGIFCIIYSAINVYSASDIGDNILNATPVDIDTNDDLTVSSKPSTAIPSNDDISGSTLNIETTSTTTSAIKPSISAEYDEKRPRTYRQKRNCTPPAIEQFPPPILPPWFREKGGLIIHILIAIFTFLGLAIVCDDYFVSSLDRICEGKQQKQICSIETLNLLNTFTRIIFIIRRIKIISRCCWCNFYGGW